MALSCSGRSGWLPVEHFPSVQEGLQSAGCDTVFLSIHRFLVFWEAWSIKMVITSLFHSRKMSITLKLTFIWHYHSFKLSEDTKRQRRRKRNWHTNTFVKSLNGDSRETCDTYTETMTNTNTRQWQRYDTALVFVCNCRHFRQFRAWIHVNHCNIAMFQ